MYVLYRLRLTVLMYILDELKKSICWQPAGLLHSEAKIDSTLTAQGARSGLTGRHADLLSTKATTVCYSLSLVPLRNRKLLWRDYSSELTITMNTVVGKGLQQWMDYQMNSSGFLQIFTNRNRTFISYSPPNHASSNEWFFPASRWLVWRTTSFYAGLWLAGVPREVRHAIYALEPLYRNPLHHLIIFNRCALSPSAPHISVSGFPNIDIDGALSEE